MLRLATALLPLSLCYYSVITAHEHCSDTLSLTSHLSCCSYIGALRSLCFRCSFGFCVLGLQATSLCFSTRGLLASIRYTSRIRPRITLCQIYKGFQFCCFLKQFTNILYCLLFAPLHSLTSTLN